MPRSRKRLVTLFCLAFMIVPLSYFVTGDNHWPLIAYTMYSDMYGKKVGDKYVMSCLVPYGAPIDEAKPDFRLMPPQIGMLYPNLFAFGKMLRYPYRNASYDDVVKACPAGTETERHACAAERLVAQALEHQFKNYQRTRKAKPKLPPLRALRLYEVEYEFDGKAKFAERSRALRAEWSPSSSEAKP